MMLSRKQADFMRSILPRITIAEGCISSGKTFVCNHKSIRHIADNYTGKGLVFFIGRTLTTLERNVLDPLASAYGSDFTYSKSAKQASLCGIKIELEGCNDVRAESKIRGTTAEFIYGDELTLWNREFLVRCMGSLRTPNACFLGTTNPDAPTNFVKTDYLNRKDELNLWNPKFAMKDNPALTKEYIEQVSKEYMGVLHDRFIKGLWVAANGVIYPLFANNPEPFIIDKDPDDIIRVNIGVDFGGNKSTSAFTATGFTRKYQDVIALYEEVRPAATEDPESLNKSFVAFVKMVQTKYPRAYYAYADSAEQILIRGMRTAAMRGNVPIEIHNAIKGEIVGRIRLVSSLMGQGRYKIMRRCKHLIGALQQAVWDSGTSNKPKLEDERLDDGSYNMDIIDAHEYTLEPVAKYLQLMGGVAR